MAMFVFIELAEFGHHTLTDVMHILIYKHHNALDLILLLTMFNTVRRLILRNDTLNDLLSNSLVLLVFYHTCIIRVCSTNHIIQFLLQQF
jgi:hypothetical protein